MCQTRHFVFTGQPALAADAGMAQVTVNQQAALAKPGKQLPELQSQSSFTFLRGSAGEQNDFGVWGCLFQTQAQQIQDSTVRGASSGRWFKASSFMGGRLSGYGGGGAWHPGCRPAAKSQGNGPDRPPYKCGHPAGNAGRGKQSRAKADASAKRCVEHSPGPEKRCGGAACSTRRAGWCPCGQRDHPTQGQPVRWQYLLRAVGRNRPQQCAEYGYLPGAEW